MRVLMSAYGCLPHAGSEPGIGWHWATSMAARNLDVTVLTTEQNRERIEEEVRQRPIPHLRFHYVPMPVARLHEGTGPHYLLWQWMALREARKLSRQKAFDVAHHVSYGSLHVPSQLWRLGIPLVFGPVGGAQTTPPSMLRYFGSAQRSETLRTALTHALARSPLHRRWLKRMGAVLAANTETLKVIRGLGRGAAELLNDTGVAQSALPSEPRRFGAQTGPLRVLWVGRFMPRKAIGLALDIFQRTTAASTLTIMGEGMDADRLRGMIAERNLQDRVFWAGHRLPWDEVQQGYASHDVLLFNSLRESGGSQLIEAMVAGLPIITLDLHGPGDLVPGDAGFKIPVHDPEQVVREMAAAIDRYAALSPVERSAMAAAGWRFTKTLTHEARAAYAERIYRRLLGASPS